MVSRTLQILLLFSISFLMVSCKSDNRSRATTTTGTSPVVNASCATQAPVALRRLSNKEYDNSVSLLIGESITPSVEFSFPADNSFKNFNHLPMNLSLSEALLEAHLAAAESIADRAIDSSKVMICSHSGTPNNCTSDIAKAFVSRAFRKVVSDSQFQEVYAKAEEVAAAVNPSDEHKEVVKQFVKHIILHPEFFFHWEAYSGDGELDDWELASRLSFFFLRSMPDDQLWADVLAGKVWDNYTSHVTRYFNSNRALEGFLFDFVGQWLGLSNVTFEGLTPQVRDSLQKELVFVMKDFLTNNRDIRKIFDSGFTYMDATLAQHYEVSGSFGSTPTKVSSSSRGNLLSMGGFIGSAESRPTNRGLHILENLLCEEIGAPTGINVSDIEKQATLKETIMQLSDDPNCSSCHQLMDPLGFGVDNFSRLGEFRTLNDEGDAVDTSGVFDGKSFSDYKGLGQILGNDSRFGYCIAKQLYTFALARVPEASDACQLAGLENQQKAQGLKFGDMVINILYSEGFFLKGSTP